MAFDVAAARKAGYNDEQIAQYLASKHGFDYAKATSTGYKAGDILAYLMQKEGGAALEATPEAEPASQKVIPGQSAETAALAAGAVSAKSIFSGMGTTVPEQFKGQIRGVRRQAIDVLPDSLDEPPPGVPYEEVDRYGGPRGYYAAIYGLKSNEELKTAKKEIQEKLTTEAKESERKIAEATPQDLNFLQRAVRSGVESTLVNAPGFAASLLTGSTIPGLVAAGAQTGFGSYEDARAAGKDALDALAYGGVDAAIEVATEILPAKYLLKMFKADSLKGVKAEIAKYAAGEIGGEQIATLSRGVISGGDSGPRRNAPKAVTVPACIPPDTTVESAVNACRSSCILIFSPILKLGSFSC